MWDWNVVVGEGSKGGFTNLMVGGEGGGVNSLEGQYSKTLNSKKVGVHDPPPLPQSSYGPVRRAPDWSTYVDQSGVDQKKWYETLSVIEYKEELHGCWDLAGCNKERQAYTRRYILTHVDTSLRPVHTVDL